MTPLTTTARCAILACAMALLIATPALPAALAAK